jgi:ABC-type nitrate/sulfonate/bicarbonate transport system substrate-binding protein
VNFDCAPRRRSVARDRSDAGPGVASRAEIFSPSRPEARHSLRKNAVRLVVAGQMALVLTGCAAPAPSPTVKLRAGYFATQDFLPYLVIQDQGFDRAHGLQFDTRSYPGGAAALTAMAEGSLDVSGRSGPCRC